MKTNILVNPPTIAQRKQKLKAILNWLDHHEADITEALQKDFKKPAMETLLTEIWVVRTELKNALRQLTKWNKPQRVRSSLFTFPSKDYIYRQPYGQVLVIAPWNYPFQLAVAPVIGAIVMGNRVVLKPSELATHTAQLLAHFFSSLFEKSWVNVVLGDAETAKELLAQRWDYIFFTGSTAVGKLVAQQAAQHLTPFTLELGGKNPCVILKDAAIELAAKRIANGKFINAGQTCIAPDYVLLPKSLLKSFTTHFKQAVTAFYGEQPQSSPDFARIINLRHFNRLTSYLSQSKILHGGEHDQADLFIAPTLLLVQSFDEAVMQAEIFGPILAIMTYESETEIENIVTRFESPLALYVFSDSQAKAQAIVEKFSFGGGCVNDTLVHFINPRLPFGGIGHAGTGAYHGTWTRDTFSHQKSITHRYNWLDLSLRYAPYTTRINQLKTILKTFF